MPKKLKIWIFLLSSVMPLATWGTFSPAKSSSDDDHEWPDSISRTALPLDQILMRLKSEIDGEVLSVEREFEYGRLLYEIKFIDKEGYVREVYVDAVSGKIVAEEDD